MGKAFLFQNAAWRRHWPIVAILLVAALVRLWGLGDYSLGWDEANVLALAKLPLKELVRVMAIRDIHPPGVHILAHGWLLLFGDSDWLVRLFYGLMGVLSVWGTYLLALEAVKDRKIAIYTAVLAILAPFLWHYAHLATHHGVFYTLCVFSWVLLLRCLRTSENKPLHLRPVFWGYALVTFWLLYSQSIAPLVLMGQALLVFSRRKSEYFTGWRPWLAFGAVALLLYVPQLWLISRPWHASHMTEMALLHASPGLLSLLAMPANLLLLGDDRLFQPALPDLPVLLVYVVTGSVLVALGVRHNWQRYPGNRALLVGMGVFPLLFLFAVSLLTQKHVFQARAFLFCFFPVALAVAAWLADSENRNRAGQARLLCIGILIVQGLAASWIFLPPPKENYKSTLSEVLPLWQAGDGVVVYPGYHHLGIIRYLAPAEFGLTERERHMNPRMENVFHMVQRIDNRYFFVSGEDVLIRPDVQAAFRVFQKKHRRVWLFGTPAGIESLFDCGTTFLIYGPPGRYWQIRCPFNHPAQCQSPLTGPDANRWQCRNGSAPPLAAEK